MDRFGKVGVWFHFVFIQAIASSPRICSKPFLPFGLFTTPFCKFYRFGKVTLKVIIASRKFFTSCWRRYGAKNSPDVGWFMEKWEELLFVMFVPFLWWCFWDFSSCSSCAFEAVCYQLRANSFLVFHRFLSAVLTWVPRKFVRTNWPKAVPTST